MASTKEIQELREKTGAGMLACKEALDDSKGDLEKAVEYNPKDTYIKDQLKNLYYRLRMMDKFEKMK